MQACDAQHRGLARRQRFQRARGSVRSVGRTNWRATRGRSSSRTRCSRSNSSDRTGKWAYCECCKTVSCVVGTDGSSAQTGSGRASHRGQNETSCRSPTVRAQPDSSSRGRSCSNNGQHSTGDFCRGFCSVSTTNSGHRLSWSPLSRSGHGNEAGFYNNGYQNFVVSGSSSRRRSGSNSSGSGEASFDVSRARSS